MKKMTRILAAAALAMSFQAGSFTAANATNNIRDLCRDLVDDGYFATMGECQSTINKDAVNVCKEYWESAGFKNRGECVAYVRAYYNDYKKS